jgi:diguanylate cyclase (GGDEF)-like protein
MPSVYLEDGGRLRCQAVRGYWQVYDGISPTAGVIGRAFRTGEPVLVENVCEHTEYLEAVSVVHAELAVPIRVGGRVVGVLNAETPTSIDRDAAADAERCAALLGTRLEDLGGCGGVSPAQQLARVAVRLNALDDPEDIVRETLAAARQLAGFESAMLALTDGHGGLYAHHAEGSFAVAFAQLERGELENIAEWVRTGSSNYTVADTGGRGFTGHEVLREAGVNALGVFPLAAGTDRLGILVVADRGNHRISTEEAELLELLATQAAGSLRMAAAVLELRERAARDPLTGLGHHATFHAELPAARKATPEHRRTALLLADVDGFKAINDAHGHAAGDDVLRSVAQLLRNLAPPDGRAFRIGGDEFAMLFECAGEDDAQAVGWELQGQSRGRLGSTLSIGLAIAEPGEGHEELVARADAAMYEVKRQGRDGVLLAAQPPATTSA